MGQKGKIVVSRAAQILVEAEGIKEKLNLLSAEMYREPGREYMPPHGFENPLKEETQE